MCSSERKNGPRVQSLAELKGAKSQRLGTEAGSVADYSLRQRGYLRRLFRNQLATLKALNDGDIDYAYLWANVGWTLHVSPDLNLELVPNYVPEDHWNIAVAMCREDDELKRHVDEALDALIADGTVARVLARYHVPYYAPFPELARDAQGNADASDPARGRGPWPRASDAEDPDVQAGVFRAGQDPLGRRAGGRAGSEQPPLLDGPSRAGRARLRDRRPARRATGRPAPGLLGHLRARFLPVEAGSQGALRRDPGRHARRSIRAAGPLFPAVLRREATNWSSGRVKVRPRDKSRWPSRKESPCAG